LVVFSIAERLAVRILLTDIVRQKLLMLLTGSGEAPPDTSAANSAPA
jgi:hypothetical protein